MKPIVFWGAAGFALELNSFLPALGYRLVALFDNDEMCRSPLPFVPLYHGMAGFKQWLAQEPRDGTACIVAIGGDQGFARLNIQRAMHKLGLHPVSLVHPSAVVADSVLIGAGTQVYGQSHIGAASRIGEGCVINGGANIQHECVIGDGAHIGPSAVLCGCVSVGENAFVGAGAIVLPRVKIGRDGIVGAGAVVTKDVEADTTVLGNPAKPFIKSLGLDA